MPRAAGLPNRIISNLEYNVSDDDIQELFATCGPLKEWNVQYDRRCGALSTTRSLYFASSFSYARLAAFAPVMCVLAAALAISSRTRPCCRQCAVQVIQRAQVWLSLSILCVLEDFER